MGNVTISLFCNQMNKLFEDRINVTLEYKRYNCEEFIPVHELNAVQSLCKLLEVLATPQNGVELGEDRDAFSNICKMWFFFWYVQHLDYFFSNTRVSMTNYYKWNAATTLR